MVPKSIEDMIKKLIAENEAEMLDSYEELRYAGADDHSKGMYEASDIAASNQNITYRAILEALSDKEYDDLSMRAQDLRGGEDGWRTYERYEEGREL